MKQKILRFDSLKNITPKGFDGIAIRYPFAMVDSQSVGLPEERQKTSQHSLEVSVSDTKLEAWKLDDHDPRYVPVQPERESGRSALV